MKKLLSFAKTLGKHIWDQNKHKIIDKGVRMIDKKLGSKIGSFVDSTRSPQDFM